jgi:hypothetical protein
MADADKEREAFLAKIGSQHGSFLKQQGRS